MKYQNRHGKKCSNKKSNISALSHAIQKSRKKFKWRCKQNNGYQIVYHRKHKEYRAYPMGKVSPTEYVIFSVLNTGVNMGLGPKAIILTCSILELCYKLAGDQVKNIYINEWEKPGYNHKHLQCIEREAKFVSLGTHAICHSGIMLVLSVFGRMEEIEDIFNALPHIR